MITTAGVLAQQQRRTIRRLALLAAGCAALLALLIADLATGPAMLRPTAVFHALFGMQTESSSRTIVWAIRFPMAMMAIVVGAALGLSGAVMQTVLNNPLASSYTLGISAGAGFGAALVIVMGALIPIPQEYAVPVAAFLFAALACAGVFLIGSAKGTSAEVLILAGIALLFLFQALISLVQFLASPEALQQVVFWLFGSLLKSTHARVGVVAVVLALVLPCLLRDAWRLTALKLGDDRARGLGIDPKALRIRSLAWVSLLTAVAVAFVGTIGFVGIIAPHIARMLLGEDQRFLLPGAALAGALLLSASSIASKIIYPGAIIPIGIVTALVGVPFFIGLVLQAKRGYW